MKSYVTVQLNSFIQLIITYQNEKNIYHSTINVFIFRVFTDVEGGFCDYAYFEMEYGWLQIYN